VRSPVAVDVYPGNTADSKTVPDQIVKIRDKFNLERAILVGDRGMLTQTQIDTLRQYPGLGWISALRSEAIAKLLEEGMLYRQLFEPTPLAEITAPDFPGERLIAATTRRWPRSVARSGSVCWQPRRPT